MIKVSKIKQSIRLPPLLREAMIKNGKENKRNLSLEIEYLAEIALNHLGIPIKPDKPDKPKKTKKYTYTFKD